MNPTERALFDRVFQLSTSTRWPSGRRVLVSERRWMVHFLASWVRMLSGPADLTYTDWTSGEPIVRTWRRDA